MWKPIERMFREIRHDPLSEIHVKYDFIIKNAETIV